MYLDIFKTRFFGFLDRFWPFLKRPICEREFLFSSSGGFSTYSSTDIAVLLDCAGDIIVCQSEQLASRLSKINSL